MLENRGRDQFYKYRSIILFISSVFRLFPSNIRVKWFIRCRNKGGYLGLVLRYALLKALARSCGENVCIQQNVFLLNPEFLSIGDNVSIHPMVYMECWGNVEIGNDVSIAQGATILSVNHNYDRMDIPIKDQGIEKRMVIIKSNVWIGAKATILGNVTVNDGVVIGAGAVVTRNIRANSVVAGVPAREIKLRWT